MKLIEIKKDGNNFVPVETEALIHCIEYNMPFQFIYYTDKEKKDYTKFNLHLRKINGNEYTYINSLMGKFIIEIIGGCNVLIKREIFIMLAA